MSARGIARSVVRWSAAGAGLASAVYAAYVAVTWTRYGHPAAPEAAEADELLDRFMPVYDVVERHHIEVRAPAATTLAAARDQELTSVPIIRAIFRGRELLLGATPDTRIRPEALLAEVQSLGWLILADTPGEVVVGAVTRPWEADAVFRPVPAADYPAFDEPGYVKIVWTLRADPLDAKRSLFLTETRAGATDAFARRRFRCYWSFLSPGIVLIRRLMLRPVKAEAERRAARL